MHLIQSIDKIYLSTPKKQFLKPQLPHKKQKNYKLNNIQNVVFHVKDFISSTFTTNNSSEVIQQVDNQVMSYNLSPIKNKSTIKIKKLSVISPAIKIKTEMSEYSYGQSKPSSVISSINNTPKLQNKMNWKCLQQKPNKRKYEKCYTQANQQQNYIDRRSFILKKIGQDRTAIRVNPQKQQNYSNIKNSSLGQIQSSTLLKQKKINQFNSYTEQNQSFLQNNNKPSALTFFQQPKSITNNIGKFDQASKIYNKSQNKSQQWIQLPKKQSKLAKTNSRQLNSMKKFKKQITLLTDKDKVLTENNKKDACSTPINRLLDEVNQNLTMEDKVEKYFKSKK